MIELIRKAMYTGLGVASLTKDKIEDIAKEFVDQGAISETEGRKLVKDLLSQMEQSRVDMKSQVEEYVQEAVAKLDIATKKDIQELSDKISTLESKTD